MTVADQALVQANIARATQMAQRAAEAGEQLSKLRVEATSRNGAAKVTVGSGGILQAISAEPSAARLSSQQLCVAIMQAYALASRRAAEQASEIMSEAVGRDTKAMQMLRAAMPEVVEDDDASAMTRPGDDNARWSR